MEGKGKGSPLQLLLTLYNNRKNKISYVFSYSLAQLCALGESNLCYFLAFPKK